MVYKQLKIRLGSWRKLRGAIPGLKGENFSDYLERVAMEVNKNNGKN